MQHLKCDSLLITLCLVLAAGTTMKPVKEDLTPTDLVREIPPGGLVQRTDITYLGSFKNAPNLRAYGMGITPNGMLMAGTPQNRRTISKQSIPNIGGQAQQIGTTISLPGDFGPNDQLPTIHGFHLADNKIIYGKYSGYSHSSQTAVVASIDINGENATAPQRVNDRGRRVNQRFYSGFMGAIPKKWQAVLGGDMFIGGGPKSIDSNASAGFAVMAIKSAEINGTGEITGRTLIEHQGANQRRYLWEFKEWNWVLGGAIIRDSFVFWGVESTGKECYGTGEACGDPCSPYQGFHAYPYRVAFWAFDLKNFIKVATGDIDRWEPEFYSVNEPEGGPIGNPTTWRAPGPLGQDGCANAYMGNNSYNLATGRVYMSGPEGDYENTYVFKIK